MAVVERLALLIDAKAGGAISELNKLNAEINMVNRTQTQATGMTGMFEKGLAKLGIQSNDTGALMKAGLAAGATAAGYAMLRFGQDAIKATTGLADAVRSVSQATGMSAESSSRLVAIFDDYGISAESAAKGISKFGRTLFENTSALEQYGVVTAKNADGQINVQRTLLNVADAYANMTDPAAKAALVNEAFGRTGRDLIPVLEQGRQGILDLYAAVPDAQILSAEDLANAREYQLAIDNLNDVMMELQVTLGTELLPVLSDAANSFATMARTIGRIGSLEVPLFNKSVFTMIGSLIDAANPIQQVVNGINDVAGMFGLGGDEADKNTAATKRNRDAQYDAALAADRQTSALTAQNEALQKSIDLVYQRINADLGVEGAQINLEKAIQQTNTVLADGTKTDLEKRESVLQSAQAIDRLITSIRAQEIASGNADGNVQRQIETLNFLKGTLDPASPLIAHLDGYIGRLNGIRSDITTRVNVIYDVTTMGAAAPPGIYEGPPPYPTGGFDGDIWTPFARGGIVTGPTKALIGEAGPEAVIPLGKGAGMGTTIQLVVDGRVLTQIVRDDLIKIGRANGSALGRYA